MAVPTTRDKFTRADRVTVFVEPPRLASFPVEREQIEYSSRSMVFRSDGDGILRVWGDCRHPWVIGVSPRKGRWRIQAWGSPPGALDRAARDLFSLDHPIEEFYRLARGDPVLGEAVRRFRGLRIPRDPSVYESLVHAVIGQQLSVAAANALSARLFSQTGAWVDVEGIQVPHVPAPDAIRALGEEGLRRVGLSRVKSAALLSLAQREAEGWFAQSPWDRLGVEEAVERLDALPGVGRWTAENALLRGAGRTDVFVAGDLAIVLALDQYGIVRKTAHERRRRAWADRAFPGWGSYVTLYLWRRWVAERSERTAG